MKLTVVTPSLNCAAYLPTNIESVRRQGLGPDEVEHWIIDGGSTDGTVELLRGTPAIQWLSEPDDGLSDAVNKGIRRARGQWIVWLNADDHLADGAFSVFLRYAAARPEARIFSGDLIFLGYDGSFEQRVPAWDYRLDDLLGGRTGINQSSTFVHRDVYATVGLLDVGDRYTMDYEWMVRAMHRYSCVPIPEVLTFYRRRRGSITDAHLVKQFENFLEIRRRYGRPYLSRAELRIRFYLYTDWLRRVRWLRREVRRVKGWLGRPPLHPM
jgi:glycosyltransferase involved in cell wall biosynthesis